MNECRGDGCCLFVCLFGAESKDSSSRVWWDLYPSGTKVWFAVISIQQIRKKVWRGCRLEMPIATICPRSIGVPNPFLQALLQIKPEQVPPRCGGGAVGAL